MNKKGDIYFLTFIPIFIFCLALTLMITNYLFSSAYNQTSTQPHLQNVTTSLETSVTATTSFDIIGIIAVGIFFIILVIANLIIPANPIFYLIYLMVGGLVVIFSAYLSNMGETLLATPPFDSVSSSFPVMSFLVVHPVMIILPAIIVSIVTLYTKGRIMEEG